jgi:hypothetical protein
MEAIMSNEFDARLLSVVGINSFMANNSSVRQYMFNSHISQAIVLDHPTPKRIQSGIEQEFGKYTFNVKMPANGRIVSIINKFNTNTLSNPFNHNPSTIVIYENLENGEYDYIEIPIYKSFHYMFGFELRMQDGVYDNLSVGKIIPKDTVIADSISVDKNGNYNFGTELNIAYMSHPAVAEDGFLICSDVLPKLGYRKYEKRVVEFGEKTFPLNLYGTPTEYKPFPDLGEQVRPDGILFASRAYNEGLSAATMSVEDVMNVDYMFDNLTYASSSQSRLLDIKIFHNVNNRYQIPTNMRAQLDRYWDATVLYYKQILEVERRLLYNARTKFSQNKIPMSRRLHRLIVEAYNMTENGEQKADKIINKVLKNKPIDTYLIEFTLVTNELPDIGSKMSGIAGDKGVIVSIASPDQMPVDKDGVRADIISDDVSTVNRMNLSRLYEQYIGRSCIHIKFMLRDVLNIERHAHVSESVIKTMITMDNIDVLKSILLEFYQIVSQKMYDHFLLLSNGEWIEHLSYVIKNGPYLYIPTNSEKDAIDIVKDIHKRYNVTKGPVTFKSQTGEIIETKDSVLIGPIYMMISEKTGETWSATSSAKYQHFGNIAAPVSKAEKYGYPYKNSAVRALGETESRAYAAYTSPLNIVELMDRSNNPMSHKEVLKSILESEHPTNISVAVDRSKIPYGGSKPLQYVKHLFFSAGIELLYTDEGNYYPNKN